MAPAGVFEKDMGYTPPPLQRSFFTSRNLTYLLVLLALAALVYYKKGWFIAATVNGRPITSLELQQRLNDNYRKQGLEDLINEHIVLDEATKNHVIPSSAEVSTRYGELEQRYGGPEQFTKFLESQGQTTSYVKHLLSVNLALENLYSKEASASAKEVDEYLRVNKGKLQATDSGGQRKEAQQAIREQKLFRLIQEKFQELKDKASVKIF